VSRIKFALGGINDRSWPAAQSQYGMMNAESITRNKGGGFPREEKVTFSIDKD